MDGREEDAAGGAAAALGTPPVDGGGEEDAAGDVAASVPASVLASAMPPAMDSKGKDAAAVAWRGAGDARAWAATIREHTAWSASVDGWAARAEAGGEMKTVAEAASEAAAAGGRERAKAAGRAAEAAGRVGALLRRASRSYVRASRYNKAAVSQLRRAARLYRRGASRGQARDVSERAKMSSEYAETASKQASDMARGAKTVRPIADALAAAAAAPEAGGGSGADASGLSRLRAELLDAVGQIYKGMEEKVERAREIERLTATAREMTEAAAKRSAAMAALAGSEPEAEKAVSAWMNAMESASRAAADDERIRRRGAGAADDEDAAEDGAEPAPDAPAAPTARRPQAPPKGGKKSDPAALVWRAAADARMWAAALHAGAMMSERRQAWAAKSRAADAMGRSAEACGQAVGEPGVIDGDAIGRSIEEIRHAADLNGLAAAAFRRSADASRATAAEQKKAAAAYVHAYEPVYRRTVRSQAAMSRGMARKADKLAAEADMAAGVLGRQADRWAPVIALWGKGKSKFGGGDGSMIMAAARSDLLGDSKQESAAAAREAERLAEGEEQAAEMLRVVKEAAGQSAADAARAGSGPGTEDAAAALKSAMAAVDRASGKGGKGG